MGRGSSKAGGGNNGGSGIPEIDSFEKRAYKQDTESALIVTANGEVINIGSGDEHHVFGANEDLKKMEGATASHNHPTDAIFSNTDVANGIAKGKLKEMRIVTKSGEIHSIKDDGATDNQRRSFNANYQNQMMKARNNVHAKERRGEKVNRDEYIKQHMGNWMTNHAEEYGLKYEKRKLK